MQSWQSPLPLAHEPMRSGNMRDLVLRILFQAAVSLNDVVRTLAVGMTQISSASNEFH